MVLHQRFDYDGKSLLSLNNLQLRMKYQIEQKIKNNLYKFERVTCAICNGSRFELLSKKDRYGLYMSVVICKDCGLIQTNPRMDQNAYSEFYNIEYRKLYRGEERPTQEYYNEKYDKGRQIFRYLDANGLLENKKCKFVLEVGCGAGGILHYFRDMGFRVKGIDLDELYVEYGKNQYGLDLSVGTIDTLKLDEAPDLIIYSHVLEHILTPSEELHKVRDILPDTGLIYIEIPGLKNKISGHCDFLKYLQNAHVYHFTLKSLKNLFAINGFELVAGNEVVNSVFRKTEDGNSSYDIENDYSDMIICLHEAEKNRRLCKGKLMFINLLKKVGLFEPVRSLYHAVRLQVEKP